MSSAVDRRFKFAQFFLIFALVYLGSQMALPLLFPDQFGPNKGITGVIVRPVDATVKGGHHPELIVINKTAEPLQLLDRCPMPPFEIHRVGASGERVQLSTEETVLPCEPSPVIDPGEEDRYSLAPWKYSLFGEYGEYEIRLLVADAVPTEQPQAPEVGTGSVVQPGETTLQNQLMARLTVHEPDVFTSMFRVFVTKPLLNLLILIASFTPGHNLGIAIILITILIKLLLFFPTQHALEGQKKLQALQPKLDEIKKQYKDNPEMLNKEIMALWKKNDVNPFQSCLPMLLQFPVLIGIFFVIRDGSVLELSRHLIYPVYQHLSWQFGTNFLWIDLTVPNVTIFPALLFVLQFLQMKLSFAIAKKKLQKSKEGQPATEKKEEKKDPLSQQEIQQKMMMYGLPVLIAVFAFQFAAGVSLYWAMSTLFAIGQQVVVNRRTMIGGK